MDVVVVVQPVLEGLLLLLQVDRAETGLCMPLMVWAGGMRQGVEVMAH
jgi:hypothetical protein